MTYGSPATLDDIPAYLANIRGGRPADDDLIAEFRRRYQLIGGSPLVRITQEQAAALQRELATRHPAGPRFRVAAGMRFAPPLIDDVTPALADDADALVGIILSPQYSPILMRGYVSTLTDAVRALDQPALALAISGDWHLQPRFIAAVAGRVRQALAREPDEVRARVPVLLTAHSMPERVVATESWTTLPTCTRRPKLLPAPPISPPTAGCSATRARGIRLSRGSNPTSPISCPSCAPTARRAC